MIRSDARTCAASGKYHPAGFPVAVVAAELKMIKILVTFADRFIGKIGRVESDA